MVMNNVGGIDFTKWLENQREKGFVAEEIDKVLVGGGGSSGVGVGGNPAVPPFVQFSDASGCPVYVDRASIKGFQKSRGMGNVEGTGTNLIVSGVGKMWVREEPEEVRGVLFPSAPLPITPPPPGKDAEVITYYEAIGELIHAIDAHVTWWRRADTNSGEFLEVTKDQTRKILQAFQVVQRMWPRPEIWEKEEGKRNQDQDQDRCAKLHSAEYAGTITSTYQRGDNLAVVRIVLTPLICSSVYLPSAWLPSDTKAGDKLQIRSYQIESTHYITIKRPKGE